VINLGLTRRWAHQLDTAAVDRCKKALKRRRSNGVGGSNYIRHIPRALYGHTSDTTLCGRVASRVNRVMRIEEIDNEDVCLRCKKARML
jgi:hypothetical protein